MQVGYPLPAARPGGEHGQKTGVPVQPFQQAVNRQRDCQCARPPQQLQQPAAADLQVVRLSWLRGCVSLGLQGSKQAQLLAAVQADAGTVVCCEAAQRGEQQGGQLDLPQGVVDHPQQRERRGDLRGGEKGAAAVGADRDSHEAKLPDKDIGLGAGAQQNTNIAVAQRAFAVLALNGHGVHQFADASANGTGLGHGRLRHIAGSGCLIQQQPLGFPAFGRWVVRRADQCLSFVVFYPAEGAVHQLAE